MNLLRTINATIEKNELIATGSHVLIGVSGGSDSVALLHLLIELSAKLKFKISVAHLDHGIRGASSREDAVFVRALAEKAGVKCVCGSVRVPIRARNAGVSIEMAARKARYEFFRRQAGLLKADSVATAHTFDDQAETVLLKLVRGAGAGGLAGVQHVGEVNGIRVIRPLMGVRKDQLIEYLKRKDIEWREDETNREMSFLRNRVRHEVIPLLEAKLNPGTKRSLVRAADILRHEDEWLGALSAELVRSGLADDGSLELEFIRSQPLAARRRAVRTWLVNAGVSPETVDFEAVEAVEALIHKRGGAGTRLSGGWAVSRYRDSLVARRQGEGKTSPFRAVISMSGETIIEAAGLVVTAGIADGIIRDKPAGAGVLPARASIGLKALGRRRIHVRSWLEGDRMKPMGMKGSRKLKSIFIDAKIPRWMRSAVPVFEAGGEIVWLPGYRVARGWEVGESNSKALHLHVARM